MADRIWLERDYLPSLKGAVLFVGVEGYTRYYHRLVRGRFATVDMRPEVAAFGSPGDHVVGDFRGLTCFGEFDHVVLYGLFGQPHSVLQSDSEIADCMRVARSLGREGAGIMIGCSTDTRSSDEWRAFMSRHATDFDEVRERLIRPSSEHNVMYIWQGRIRTRP